MLRQVPQVVVWVPTPQETLRRGQSFLLFDWTSDESLLIIQTGPETHLFWKTHIIQGLLHKACLFSVASALLKSIVIWLCGTQVWKRYFVQLFVQVWRCGASGRTRLGRQKRWKRRLGSCTSSGIQFRSGTTVISISNTWQQHGIIWHHTLSSMQKWLRLDGCRQRSFFGTRTPNSFKIKCARWWMEGAALQRVNPDRIF